jgi:NDP-sugar pyrophosphorylase family protein
MNRVSNPSEKWRESDKKCLDQQLAPMYPLALLAGGQATRLRPITERIPKAMVEVAGEPFIAHQLRLVRREGVSRVVICTGHLAEQIQTYVGSGTAFGMDVAYSLDGPTLLGTGGALKKALPLLGERFIVMYGDSYLDTRFAPIVEAFEQSGLPALMTVFRNENRWDTSNVEFAGGAILRYDKIDRRPSMHYIDYGLGVLSARVFEDWPAERPFDLAGVYRRLVDEHRLAGYEVRERFYEIGSHRGLLETDTYLQERKGATR